MKRFMLLSLALIFCLGFLVGCVNESPSETATTALEGGIDHRIATNAVALTPGVKVVFITTDVKHGAGERDDESIRRQVEQFINGGSYEIVAVTLNRAPDFYRYLRSAEIYYRVRTDNDSSGVGR